MRRGQANGGAGVGGCSQGPPLRGGFFFLAHTVGARGGRQGSAWSIFAPLTRDAGARHVEAGTGPCRGGTAPQGL